MMIILLGFLCDIIWHNLLMMIIPLGFLCMISIKKTCDNTQSEDDIHRERDLAKFGYNLHEPCIEIWRFFLKFGRILAFENL
jgi:hypothetical protein